MTIIATFAVNQYPVLLGDLLISGNEELNSSTNLPIIGDIRKVFPKGSGFVPTSLRQKIAIVNDNLCLGWSGRSLSAQIIIKELFKEARRKPNWNSDDILSFLSSFDSEHKDKVGIVGYSNDGRGIFPFGYGVGQAYQSPKHGLVRLSGTGATTFKSYLDDFNVPAASGRLNPLDVAVGNTLGITTLMTGLEPDNLLSYFGGGYEIALLVRRKFTKIDDVTYLVWVGDQINASSWKLNFPHIFIKYYYRSDLLFIKRAEYRSQSDGSLGTGQVSNNPSKCYSSACLLSAGLFFLPSL